MWYLAALATAFNLHCTGNRWSGDFLSALGGAEKKPFATEFHIDLAARRWCWDACSETHEIAKMDRTSITIVDVHTHEGEHTARVNRETGEYYENEVTYYPEYVEFHVGSCERRPFTGFPRLKF